MLIRRPGQVWHALEASVHDERALQTLLAQSPGLLPNSGAGEMAVVANFRLGSSSPLDLLAVGADGGVALVECSRQDVPGRRPMGGSSLAAAANLWRLPYADFDAAFASRAGVPLVEAVATVAQTAGTGFNGNAFREAVTASLSEGRFQIVFAVDTVSDEVRRIVSYLNSGSRPGLTAVALGLRYMAEEGIEILFPTVFAGEGVAAPSIPVLVSKAGASSAASSAAAPVRPVPAPAPEAAAPATPAPASASSPTPAPGPGPVAAAPTSPSVGASPAPATVEGGASTTIPAVDVAQREAALFAALEASCLPAAVAAVRTLYTHATRSAKELQWGQGEHPAVTAVYDVGGPAVGVWSCYTDLKPSFVVNFEWLVPHVSTAGLERLAEKLGQLPSVPERLAGLSEAGYRRRLALAVNAVLAQPGAADVIGSAIEDLVAGGATDVTPPPTTGRRKG